MKYQLLGQVDNRLRGIEQVLLNRGIPLSLQHQYLYTTDEMINSPNKLGEDNIKQGIQMLLSTIKDDADALLIVDCDCDGATSAALIFNYLFILFPAWVTNHLKWRMHSGKQHGLNDHMDYIREQNYRYKLILCPDSSSNDYDEHEELFNHNTNVLVLDHHNAPKISEWACVINNQLSDYPNKFLSGVGVTWQFCRKIDELLNTTYSNNFLDLVALGNLADVMSLKAIETKHLIHTGLRDENILNPFIFELAKKNKYSLGEVITPMGAAFYIAPFINAMMRSGTLEEKKLMFSAMLTKDAFNIVPSTKRGCIGQTETLVEQAVRTCVNVKNRQSRAVESGMEFLERQIQENNMLQHKVLLFLLNGEEIDSAIRGLAANKIANKYQRPCCVLSLKDGCYQGSARGYERTGIKNFAKLCEDSKSIDYVIGHENAFGISIPQDKVEQYMEYMDDVLKNQSSEPIYLVDYIFSKPNGEIILSIANFSYLWGKDIEESLVALENITISSKDIQLLSKDKNPTLRIKCGDIELMKFKSCEEEYNSLIEKGNVTLNIVGKCNKNEWGGNTKPQILIEDYEITGSVKWLF